MVSPFDLMFWAGIIVLILILGPSKIPSLARAVGEAVREWKRALEGLPPSEPSGSAPAAPAQSRHSAEEAGAGEDHPIVKAAVREGIDVEGKSLDEIAEELARRLKERRMLRQR